MKRKYVQVRSLSFSDQGERESQEDRMVELDIGDTGFLAAIIDGHGGHETAHAVAETLRHEAPFFRMTLTLEDNSQDVALLTMFSKLEHATTSFTSGAVLTLALINKRRAKAIICQLGDTTALHFRDNKLIYRTPTHNARANLKEREAILAKGASWHEERGYLNNGIRMVQPARVLGNRLFPELVRVPEIIRRDLLPNDVIALLSDGVITTDDEEDYALEAATLAQITPLNAHIAREDVRGIVRHGMKHRYNSDNGSAIFLLCS